MRGARHATFLLEPDAVRIPMELRNLAAFRAWTRSAGFPEEGRIDWIAGELEIDMSPEELNTHSSPKTAIAYELTRLIEHQERGVVYIDSTRVVHADADLSVEPDIVVLLVATLEAGRARLVPKARSAGGLFTEIEGAVDLVVECVSESSATKDYERLRHAYHRAGVREYWIVDARDATPQLLIHRRAPGRFVRVRPEKDGSVHSPVLGVAARLTRHPLAAGLVRHRLMTW